MPKRSRWIPLLLVGFGLTAVSCAEGADVDDEHLGNLPSDASAEDGADGGLGGIGGALPGTGGTGMTGGTGGVSTGGFGAFSGSGGTATGGTGGSTGGTGGSTGGTGGSTGGTGGSTGGTGGSTGGTGGSTGGTGGSTGGTGGSTGGTGGGGPVCPLLVDDPNYPDCDPCMRTKCNTECNTCANNQECLLVLDCISWCLDNLCVSDCLTWYPDGATDLLDLAGDNGCLTTDCSVECGDTTSCSVANPGRRATPDAGILGACLAIALGAWRRRRR